MLMRTWTNEQLAILDSEYPTANLKELAGRLDKTPEAVKAKALIRKLKRSPDVRVWSPVKRQKLIALYPDHTNLEIALQSSYLNIPQRVSSPKGTNQ